MNWVDHRTSILLVISFMLLFSGFWFFPSFAFIFFISILLQLLLKPVVDKMERRRIPRALAAVSVLGLTVLITLIAMVVLTHSFIPTFSRFILELPSLTYRLQHVDFIESYPILNQTFDNMWDDLSTLSIGALKSSLTIALSLFNKVIDFVITLFVTFYLLKDGDDINDYIAGLFPSDSHERVKKLFYRILHALQIYINSQIIMCCITAAITASYFTLAGLPYASVFAVSSGIAEFIPVIGPTAASCFGITLTATTTPFMAFQTAVFYLIMTQINHNLIYPWLIGRSLNLHPVGIILGIIFGGEILGAAGMFLAVPCIVVFKHVIEDIHDHEKSIFAKKATH